MRGLRGIGPIYAGMSAGLTLLLILAGDRPFIALCHAMAVLSTSSVSPVGGLEGSHSGPPASSSCSSSCSRPSRTA